ncbi:MAG: hypothetical protein ABFR63_02260 [Thermodesulfobacteriota bacterium]
MNSEQKRTDMLEMYTDGARVIEGTVKRGLASPMGIFAYAAVSGILGVLILMAFFSMLLSTSALVKILPIFIGFNAAASAYGIVEKGGPLFPRPILSMLTLSTLYALTEAVLVTVLLPWEPMVVCLHLLIGSLTALCFSYLGARLARKTREINRASQT